MTPRAILAAALATIVATLAVSAARADPAQVMYAAYASGLQVTEVQATVDVRPQSYRLQLSFHLTGVIGAVFHAAGTATVDGRFAGAAAVPREAFSAGHFRGQPRVTQIDWQDGVPTVTRMVPPVEPEREPVPAAEQAHTVDGLSAIAVLLHQLATTGRCEGAVNTYDGRRLTAFAAHTVGEETLEATDRSSFRGTALRCDVEARMTGGFERDSDPNLRRPVHATAWFARLEPGAPPLPVRILVHTRDGGDAVTLYVTGSP